jgi:hypothetical protein
MEKAYLLDQTRNKRAVDVEPIAAAIVQVRQPRREHPRDACRDQGTHADASDEAACDWVYLAVGLTIAQR